MKIVVLAGGLSTERQVALTSGTGVCRALRERVLSGTRSVVYGLFKGKSVVIAALSCYNELSNMGA